NRKAQDSMSDRCTFSSAYILSSPYAHRRYLGAIHQYFVTSLCVVPARHQVWLDKTGYGIALRLYAMFLAPYGRFSANIDRRSRAHAGLSVLIFASAAAMASAYCCR